MPSLGMTTAISDANHATGTDHDNILYVIRMYSTRNETMYSTVDVYIKECDWQSLDKQPLSRSARIDEYFG